MLCKACKTKGFQTFTFGGVPALVDSAKMCATGLLSTVVRDRQGDILEASGIDTTAHRLNPVVLLEHGLQYPLPIGATQDEQGQYTVEILGAEAKQTTYFNPQSAVAEQVFELLASDRPFLWANSIGYRTLEADRLRADTDRGIPPGQHIKRCELVEVSWVVVPANQEAVTSLLDEGKIGGKAIVPCLKQLLTPYRSKKTAWSNGANMKWIDEDEKDMSSIDEANGGALRPDEEEEEVKLDEPEEVGAAEPLGATMLRDLHGDLLAVVSSYQSEAGQLEQPKVKKAVEKMLEDLGKSSEEVAKVFASVYPDLEGLSDAPPAEEPVEDDDEDLDDFDGGDEETDLIDDEADDPQVKCMQRAKAMISDMADQEQDKRKRIALKRILKEMQVEEEEGSQEEMASLKSLERSIVRRERMLSRIGL